LDIIITWKDCFFLIWLFIHSSYYVVRNKRIEKQNTLIKLIVYHLISLWIFPVHLHWWRSILRDSMMMMIYRIEIIYQISKPQSAKRKFQRNLLRYITEFIRWTNELMIFVDRYFERWYGLDRRCFFDEWWSFVSWCFRFLLINNGSNVWWLW